MSQDGVSGPACALAVRAGQESPPWLTGARGDATLILWADGLRDLLVATSTCRQARQTVGLVPRHRRSRNASRQAVA